MAKALPRSVWSYLQGHPAGRPGAHGIPSALIIRICRRLGCALTSNQNSPHEDTAAGRPLQRSSGAGGCGRRRPFDQMSMADDSDDLELLLEEWRGDRATEHDLYVTVRVAIHQGARRGTSVTIASVPDEQDVCDVAYEAFREFASKDPNEIRTMIGFANHIATQRGRDRGRIIIRDREKLRNLMADWPQRAGVEFSAEDARIASEREVLARFALDCMSDLPAEQQSVIAETILKQTSLSDWALAQNKSHQAASRQRMRALESLHRCIQRKRRKHKTREENGNE